MNGCLLLERDYEIDYIVEISQELVLTLNYYLGDDGLVRLKLSHRIFLHT